MCDQDKFQQWVDTLSLPEMLSIVYADTRGAQTSLTLAMCDLENLLYDMAIEGTLDYQARIITGRSLKVASVVKCVLRSALRGYFKNHRFDCEEELQPRYNGPPVEQTNRDALEGNLRANMKEWNDA